MPLCACSWGASPEAPSAWRPKSERDIALEHVRTPAMRSIYALMRRTALGDLRRSTRLACSTFATSRGISGIRSWPLPHPLRCRDEQFDLQPGACSGIHQSVEAELVDLALQQRVEARLSEAEACGRPSLRHAASLNKLLDADHDLRTQSKVARFGLSETEIPKDVAAAPHHLHSFCHR